MRNNIKTNTEGETDVKVEKVINYQPLDTAERDDDDAWNVMEFYGESDGAESDYISPKKVAIKDVFAKIDGSRIRRKIRMMSREAA